MYQNSASKYFSTGYRLFNVFLNTLILNETTTCKTEYAITKLWICIYIDKCPLNRRVWPKQIAQPSITNIWIITLHTKQTTSLFSWYITLWRPSINLQNWSILFCEGWKFESAIPGKGDRKWNTYTLKLWTRNYKIPKNKMAGTINSQN